MFELKEKTWKKMSRLERVKFAGCPIWFAAGYFALGIILAYMDSLVALPMFVLAVLFFLEADHHKTRKILTDEIRGKK